MYDHTPSKSSGVFYSCVIYNFSVTTSQVVKP